MPLGLLFSVVSVVYFNLDYDFNKAMKLGVLSGVFIGLFVSLIAALILLLMRSTQKGIQSKKQKPEKIRQSNMKNENTIESLHSQKVENPPKSDILKDSQTSEQKFMLLMDKELAYEVLYYVMTNQNLDDITTNRTSRGTIAVHAKNETIQITIDSLTKHTSQLIVRSKINTIDTQEIITAVKEKEHSFLQY